MKQHVSILYNFEFPNKVEFRPGFPKVGENAPL